MSKANQQALKCRRDLTTRALHVRTASADEKGRSVEAVLATEEPTRVFDWRAWEEVDEILVARGATLPTDVRMLDTHWRSSIDDVIGSVREMKREGDQIVGRLYFVEGDDKAERAWNKVAQGHVTDVSVGYRVEAYVDIPAGTTQNVNGRAYTAGKRALRVTTDWTVKEASLVPVGADEAAKIRSEVEIADMTTPKKEDPERKESEPVATTLETRTAAPEATPATFKDLKRDFPDATPEFRERCLEGDMTLDQARALHTRELETENAALRKEKEEREATATSTGVEPLGTATGKREAGSEGDEIGEPIAAFDAAVRERTKGGMSRREAVTAVVRSNPDLHAAYIEATNDGDVKADDVMAQRQARTKRARRAG